MHPLCVLMNAHLPLKAGRRCLSFCWREASPSASDESASARNGESAVDCVMSGALSGSRRIQSFGGSLLVEILKRRKYLSHCLPGPFPCTQVVRGFGQSGPTRSDFIAEFSEPIMLAGLPRKLSDIGNRFPVGRSLSRRSSKRRRKAQLVVRSPTLI